MDTTLFLRLAICFLAGSIPFAVVAMLGTGIDIRQVGSGNPGFNNVLRISKPRALLTLLGDGGKGALAAWLFLEAGDTMMTGWLYGFTVILGHCYSPWLKFQGGKGIATSGGVMLVLYPSWAAAALSVFVVVRVAGSKLKWREAGMIASLAAWLAFTILMALFVGSRDAEVAAGMTVFLAWRHKQNFRNLLGA